MNTTYQLLFNPASGAPYEFRSASRFGSLLIAVAAHLCGLRVWRSQFVDGTIDGGILQGFDSAAAVLPRIAGLFWVLAPDSW